MALSSLLRLRVDGLDGLFNLYFDFFLDFFLGCFDCLAPHFVLEDVWLSLPPKYCSQNIVKHLHLLSSDALGNLLRHLRTISFQWTWGHSCLSHNYCVPSCCVVCQAMSLVSR